MQRSVICGIVILMRRRKSADWMTIWDDRLLELLSEEGPAAPTPLAEDDHIHINPSSVSRRLRRLKEFGLVQALGNGVYSISPEGEQYLKGELDASEIESESEPENGDSHAEA